MANVLPGGITYLPTTGSVVQVPAGASATYIQTLINSLGGSGGGGTVQLAGSNYNLSQTLVPASGVRIKGVPPQLVYNTIPDSGLTTLVGSVGGTVLTPTGAFPAISWNTGVLGAPGSQTVFSQLALTNIAFEDLGFNGVNGGTWGILAGNTNNSSCWYSQFKNLYFTGFAAAGGGGLSITNYQHCQFVGNYTFGCNWGQLHQIDVASASLAPGNSTYYDLYNCNTPGAAGLLQRNVSFITTATTGGAANNNEFKFDRIQSNRFGGATISQAATMGTPVATVITNTSANIAVTQTTAAGDPVGFSATVGTAGGQVLLGTIYYVLATGLSGSNIQVSATPGGTAITFNAGGTPNLLFGKITITDGTKFAVGLPVSVDATQDGFTLKKVYWVVALAGNVIQLANSYGGAPIAATATTAVNVVHTGFPCFEMIALSGSNNTNLVMDNIDCEGLSTAAMFFQNVNGGVVTVSQVPSIVQATQSIVCRGCANMIFQCPQSVSTDWDNGTNGGAMGFYGARFGTSVGYMGYGTWYDSVSALTVTSFGSTFDTQSTAGLGFSASAGNIVIPGSLGISEKFVVNNNATPTLGAQNMSTNTTFGSNGTTISMPNVNATNLGMYLETTNTTASAQIFTTVGGTQLFNNIAARTTVTVNVGASVRFKASQWTGVTFGYAVIASSSAMAAGVIAAGT